MLPILKATAGFSSARPNAFRSDAIVNPITGFGTALDKLKGTRIQLDPAMDHTAQTALFHDDLPRRVVMRAPEDTYRKAPKICELDNPKVMQSLERDLKRFKIWKRLRDCWIFDRNYGGAALVVFLQGDTHATMQEPLDLNTMRPGSLRNFYLVDRRFLTPADWDNDPGSINFGEPSHYYVTPQAIQGPNDLAASMTAGLLKVHRSRMILFQTELTTIDERIRRNSWGLSIHEVILKAILSFHAAFSSADQLLAAGHQGVYKIKGFSEILASQSMDLIYARLNAVDLYRSVMRAIVLDADQEDFEWKTAPLTELANVLTQYGRRVSSAAKMPYTILMSDSPSGLNATGESDLAWWYGQIRTHQTIDVAEQNEQAVTLLLANLGVKDPYFKLEWPELWEPTPTQRADLGLKQAQQDQAYVNMGMVAPEELALMRMRPDGWNTGYQLTDEQRAARERAVKDLLAEQPKLSEGPGNAPKPTDTSDPPKEADPTPGDNTPKPTS